MKRTKWIQRTAAAVFLSLMVTGCAGQETEGTQQAKKEVVVFAAASMTECLTELETRYEAQHSDIDLVFNFDSSGTLKTQIQQGATADLFISAGQLQMDQLDQAASPDVNTEGLDFVRSDTRVDLLQNTVVLIVPEGKSGVTSFEDVAGTEVSLIALGNSDVPVGQYAQQIFEHMGLWDQLTASGKISYGTNVKEVLSQVAAGSVDCGVVYKTDAAVQDGVTVAAVAPEDAYEPAVYPAAVLKSGSYPEEAAEFLSYLQGEEAAQVFASVGFDKPAE